MNTSRYVAYACYPAHTVKGYINKVPIMLTFPTERESQPHLRYQQRRIQGKRLRAEQVCKGTGHQSGSGGIERGLCFFRGRHSCIFVLRDLHLDKAYHGFLKPLAQNYTYCKELSALMLAPDRLCSKTSHEWLFEWFRVNEMCNILDSNLHGKPETG